MFWQTVQSLTSSVDDWKRLSEDQAAFQGEAVGLRYRTCRSQTST